jgi:outer membrane protein TolC
MIKHFLILSSLFFSFSLLAASFQLTEENLLKSSKEGSPALDEIEAAFLSVAIKEGEKKEKYAPELFGQGVYSETNERALIRFQPVFSPVVSAQLGVRQNMGKGFETSASVVTDQRSAAPTDFTGKFKDVTTSTIRFTMQMDLWKNLLGRLDEADLLALEQEKQRAKLEAEVRRKTFAISLRRLYWSLVGNHEAMKIATALLKTSESQRADANLRLRNAIAEEDELARYTAQVASRQGTILMLEYQREIYLKQLKNLLPHLNKEEIVVEDYNIEKTLNEVVACTKVIAGQKKIPFEFTKYDEMVDLTRKIKNNRRIINSRYSDIDVKLFGTVKATGVNSEPSGTGYRGSYGGSFDDMTSTNRSGYEAGLMFTMPLGSTKDNVQKTKELYDEKRLLASIDSSEAQVANTHAQLVKSIGYLNEVIAAQKTSSEQLGKRLSLMRRKYAQARVSVNDLVQDQDALLNSELTTIDTQLQILNTIFDYLVIFTDTPCAFNRN